MSSAPGRMMRPSPAVARPAVALNNPTLAAWFDPVSSTRVPHGIDIDNSLSKGLPCSDDSKVSCSYATRPSSWTISMADLVDVYDRSTASTRELSRATTAAKLEID